MKEKKTKKSVSKTNTKKEVSIEEKVKEVPIVKISEEERRKKEELKERLSQKKKKYGKRNVGKILYIVIAVFFLMLSAFLSYNYYKKVIAVYRPSDLLEVQEKNDINYLVFMKENEYYEEKYLGMNQSYIYSYTDFVRVNNVYSSKFNEDLNAQYTYKVVVNLIARHVRGQGNNPIIWSKEDPIDSGSGAFNKTTTFDNSYDIDLDKYKTEVERFARTVDVAVGAEIRIDFIIDLAGEENRFKSSYVRSITIPLADEVYQISLSDNNEKKVEYNVSNKGLFTIGFFASSINIIVSWVIVFLAIKGIFSSKSIYRQTIDSYLKVYDEIIINTDSPMDFNKYEILMIDEFKELLDLSGNINIPIMFYENNQGGLFYIFYNNMVYLHIVKID